MTLCRFYQKIPVQQDGKYAPTSLVSSGQEPTPGIGGKDVFAEW
jgi:hypothetical protein